MGDEPECRCGIGLMTQSPIVQILTDLVRLGVAEEELAKLTETELLAIGSTWELWQRPSQRIPPERKLDETLGMTPSHPSWPLWGRTWPGEKARVLLFIGGRGTGKSTANFREAHRRAMSMEWPSFVCVAQTWIDAIKIFVRAEHGLINGAPPWERPYKTAGPGGEGLILRYPSGAEATIATAGGTDWRGSEFHGALCTEVAYWPNAHCLDAWNALQDCVRLGDGDFLVDSTPSDGNPVIKQIKDHAEETHRVQWVRLPPGENNLFLVDGYEEDMRRRYAGTFRELEEIEGIEGGERGMVKRADIEKARRHKPSHLDRSIIVLDPAITDPTEGKTDPIGLVAMGKGPSCHEVVEGHAQLYVLEDRSGLIAPEGEGCWPQLTVDMYIEHKADCLIVETNRGGRLNTALIRTWAEKRGWHLVIVDLDAKTRHTPGTIYVKEVYARQDKPMRFELGSRLYRDGRVSHVIEADLDHLEGTLTTWYPKKRGAQSPGDLDCVAWGCVELEGYHRKGTGDAEGQRKAVQEARARRQPDRAPVRQLRPHGGRTHKRWKASEL
jgi:phage terminase large subunit-like protein